MGQYESKYSAAFFTFHQYPHNCLPMQLSNSDDGLEDCTGFGLRKHNRHQGVPSTYELVWD